MTRMPSRILNLSSHPRPFHEKFAARIGPTGPILTWASALAKSACRARMYFRSRLTVITKDHCGQAINPLFYLHTFMNRMLLPARGRVVKSLTNIVASGSLDGRVSVRSRR